MQSSFQQIRAVDWLVDRWASAVRVLLALCPLALAIVGGPAGSAEVAMAVEVPAGQFKRARLPNLPKDAVLAVAVQTSASGKLVLILINERAYQRPAKPEEPIFMGSVERRLSFTVTIPETGNYLLVLDNRKGVEAQKIKLGIRAERGPAPQQPPPPPQQPPLQLEPSPPRPEAPSPPLPGPAKRLDKL
jgi:hypothetical protein